MPPGVWKPPIMTSGRSGRIFSRRIRASAAWTSACCEASSGRLVSAILLQVVERQGGVDQGDLKVIVLERDDHRARVEPQDLREVGAVHAPGFARGGRLLLEVGDHVPGPIDLDPGTRSLLNREIRSTRSCPRSTA